MDYKQFKMERKREAERTARDVAFLHKLAYTGLNPWYKGDGTAEFKKPEPVRPVTTKQPAAPKATTQASPVATQAPATPVSKPPEPPKTPALKPETPKVPSATATPATKTTPVTQTPTAMPVAKPVEAPKQPAAPAIPQTPELASDKAPATQATQPQTPVTAASAIEAETQPAPTPVPSTPVATPTVSNSATNVSPTVTQPGVPDYISQLSEQDRYDMSKFKSREDWIKHGRLGHTLGSVHGEQMRAEEWDDHAEDNEVRTLAKELGIDISNGYEVQRRNGQIVSINGVPIPAKPGRPRITFPAGTFD